MGSKDITRLGVLALTDYSLMIVLILQYPREVNYYQVENLVFSKIQIMLKIYFSYLVN